MRVKQVDANGAFGEGDAARQNLRAISAAFRERLQVLKPLQEKLRDGRDAQRADRPARGQRTRSPEELEREVAKLQDKMASGGISLAEEKKCMKDIAALEKQRRELLKAQGEAATAPVARRAAKPDFNVAAAKHTVGYLRDELDVLKAREGFYRNVLDKYMGESKAARANVTEIIQEKDELRKQREEVFKKILALNKSNSPADKEGFKLRKMARKVREQVEQKDFAAAKETAAEQVERFFSQCWGKDPEFRKQYKALNDKRSKDRFKGSGLEEEVDKEIGIDFGPSRSTAMTEKDKAKAKDKAAQAVADLLAAATKGKKF